MFKRRSYQKELLDEPIIPKKDLFQNLRELHTINRLLGGYNLIFEGIKVLIKDRIDPTSILDIGSGGGDTLKMVHQKFSNNNELRLAGVDLKPDCINYARDNCQGKDINFIESDYRDLLDESHQYDIIITSLFCHHLEDDEIVDLLRWMTANAKVGIVINDLNRHFLAYYSIKWLTSLFSKSYLVKNDAPLSVLRSFKRKEWLKLLDKADIDTFQLSWKWAFRWLLVIKTTAS